MQESEDIECVLLENEKVDYDISFKIVVVGNTGVGKSSLTKKAIQNIFTEDYRATIGFEFYCLNYKIADKVVKLQIWDTCGQEIYRSIVSNFYRSSSFAFLVYSIDRKDSYDSLSTWLAELRSYSPPDLKIFLVGNKSDLDLERQVTYEEGEQFQIDNNIDDFFETSAKEGYNTSEAFAHCAKFLYREYLAYKEFYGDSIKSVSEHSVKSRTTQNSFKIGRENQGPAKDAREEDFKEKSSCAC